MEERQPLLKQADVFVFKKIDEFRATPAYAKMLETYGGLDENEQKVAKALLLAATAIIPFIFLFTMWIANYSVKSDLETRTQLLTRMQDIISQNNAAGNLMNSVAAPMAIQDQGAMSSQVNNIASSVGVDAGKMRVSNFTADPVSTTLTRAEADFKFEALTTPQLMGLFTAMIGRERFRVSSVNITRNAATNLLDGTFHAVHFGQVPPPMDN